MNPSMGLAVRARAVELCRMPSLAILLTLEHAHNNPEGMF
jgi:integrator complex subunit 2